MRRLLVVLMLLPALAAGAAEAPPESAAPADQRAPAFPLEPHRQIYVLPLAYDAAAPRDRQDLEVKFQISLKKRLFDAMPLYVAYTQKSFWQLYDKADSSPFRESDYNPEAFLDYGDAGLWGLPLGWVVGLEHESNGQSLPRSRSWNRAYLQPSYRLGGATIALKLWQRFPEARKRNPESAAGDDNPDIVDYLGVFELTADFPLNDRHRGALLIRKGERDDTGAYEADYFYQAPWLGRGVLLQLQYFYGYGESLIDYNRRVKKVGIGFAFQ